MSQLFPNYSPNGVKIENRWSERQDSNLRPLVPQTNRVDIIERFQHVKNAIVTFRSRLVHANYSPTIPGAPVAPFRWVA